MSRGLLDILARANLTLISSTDGRSVQVKGTLEAHHDSIVGTQKGHTLDLSGELTAIRDGDFVQVSLVLGNIRIQGKLELSGLTLEQTLFLCGRPMPGAVLAGSGEDVGTSMTSEAWH